MRATAPSPAEYPAAGIACPRCGAWMWAHDASGEVHCHCGYVADAAVIRETAFLRARLPGWNQRLASLEEALAGAASAVGSASVAAPAAVGVAPSRGMQVSGAYAALVTLGALLIAAGVLALTVVLWEAAGPWGQAALMATVSVLIAATAVLLRTRIPATANALAVIAVLVWTAFAVLTARSIVGLELDDAGWVLATASTAGWTWVAGWRWRLRPWTFMAVVAAPAAVAFALVLAALRVGGAVALVAAATLLGLGAVGLFWRSWRLPSPERIVAGLTAALGAYVIAASSLFVSQAPSVFAALSVGLLVVAAACWRVVMLRPMALLMAGIAVGLTAGLGWMSPWWSAGLVAVVVVAGVLLPRLPWAWLAALGAAGSWAVLAAVEYGDGDPEPWWAYVALLAVASACVAGVAVRDRHAEWLLLSAGLAAPAVVWAVMLAFDVGHDFELEWFTLPLALLLLVYGLLAAWLRPGQSSLVTFGPAVAMALWPTAAGGLLEEDTARLYAVLVVGAVVLFAGLFLRWAGLVAPAAVALAAVALRPLSLLVQWMPSWVAYTVAGALLLVTGARFEHVRSGAASVRHWAHDYFR